MSLAQDIRFGFRVLVKSPGFTFLVILALALGIGTNTMVFAIYNGALLKSLPFENPHQVVAIRNRNTVEGYRFSLSYPDYINYCDQARSFSVMGALTYNNYTISDDSHTAESVSGNRISSNTFALIGQKPLLGRDFNPEDGKPGAEAVTILSHTIWQLRYGGDPDILGRIVRINGQPTTVVGVMREQMQFPESAVLWVPFVPTEQEEQNRRQTILDVYARLRDGVSLDQARVEMKVIAHRLSTAYPDTNKNVEADVRAYIDTVIDDEDRGLLKTLMGSVTFVMLIACANVANLLLSRAVLRLRETSIRTALGARRWRIVRQLLVESVVMGFMGGILGLLFATIGIRLFSIAVVQLGIPYWMNFSMDSSVFGYLFILCFVTGVAFGIAPALQISRVNVNDVLKEGGRGSSGGRRSRYLTSALMIFEIALTIVLMAGGGLMIRSFLKMQVMDVGVNAENLLTARIRLLNTKYRQPSDRSAFVDRIVERVGGLPGVEAFTIASAIPANGALSRELKLEDRDISDVNHKFPDVATVIVAPGYFQALGLALRRGRDFTASDGAKGYPAAIVNERFANQYWPGEDPIGKRIQISGADQAWLTVIGIAPPIFQSNFRQRQIDPIVYVPVRQQPLLAMSLIARTRAARESITRLIREEIRKIDADIPLFDILSIEDVLD